MSKVFRKKELIGRDKVALNSEAASVQPVLPEEAADIYQVCLGGHLWQPLGLSSKYSCFSHDYKIVSYFPFL